MRTHPQSLLLQITKPNQTLSTTRILHGLIIKSSLSVDPFYATKILRFYAVNDDLLSARNVFDRSPERSVYLWNSVIRAYAQAGDFSDAFSLFRRMLHSETPPDNYTFACLARACADRFDVKASRVLHGKVVSFGLEFDFISNSALVSCYSKLGLADEASSVFRRIDEPDLVLCNAMVSCYGSRGDWMKGVELFNTMRSIGIQPDGYTVVGLIVGLTDLSTMNVGEMIHAFCVKCGLDLIDHVGSVLVGYYSRCKNVDLACKVFENLNHPDLVSWSTLIAGLSQSGDYLQALTFFRGFLVSGKKPDPPLLATSLAASAQLAFVNPGCEIHSHAIRHGYDEDIAVSSALIDMYAKCGFLEMGIKVFKKMPKRNIVSFNTVISSLGLYGRGADAMKLFDEILEEGFRPDETTFTSLLCACSHSGLVKEGKEYFRLMRERFGFEGKTEHFVYMVKILGMDGRLREAYDLIKSLPEPVDSGIWGALLSCCEYYKDYELLEVITKNLLEKEPRNSSYSVMVSNLFAGDGRWENVEQLRADNALAKGKMAGSSWISF